jgi:transcriptional regulator with XRE-family HTH domain
MSVLGNNIKKYRELKGYTQKQLAEIVGKSKNVISNWENGLNKPDPATIEILLGALDVDANTLLGWDKPEQITIDAQGLADKILLDPKTKSILPIIVNLQEKDKQLVIDFIKRLAGKDD